MIVTCTAYDHICMFVSSRFLFIYSGSKNSTLIMDLFCVQKKKNIMDLRCRLQAYNKQEKCHIFKKKKSLHKLIEN